VHIKGIVAEADRGWTDIYVRMPTLLRRLLIALR